MLLPTGLISPGLLCLVIHEFVGVVEEVYRNVAQERYRHLIGKYEENLVLAEKHGVRTYVLDDAQSFALKDGRRAEEFLEGGGHLEEK